MKILFLISLSDPGAGQGKGEGRGNDLQPLRQFHPDKDEGGGGGGGHSGQLGAVRGHGHL